MPADHNARAVLRVLCLVRDGGDLLPAAGPVLCALRDEGAVESTETPTYPGAPPSVEWRLTQLGYTDIAALEALIAR